MSDFHFIKFTDELQQRSDLGIGLIYLYSVMFDQYEYWIKKAGKYTPTQEYLSIKCNISTGSVKNYIRLMEKLGMCKIVSKGAKGQTANSYVMYDYRKIDGILTKPSLKEYYEAKHLADELLEEWDIPAKEAEPEAQQSTEASYSSELRTEPEPPQEPVITPDEPTYILPIETPQNEAQAVIEPNPELALTDMQIESYCNITKSDPETVKKNLASEPTAASAILDVISNLSKEQETSSYFTRVVQKADPHFKGTTPDYVDDMCPF